MEEFDRLFELNSPTFFVAVMETDEFEPLSKKLAKKYPSMAIRLIDGEKCRTKAAFFKQVGEVLEFPDYFGNNWDAFNDSIADLSWLEGDAQLLMVQNALNLLAESGEKDFETMLEIFSDTHKEVVTLSKDDGEEYAVLHVLLHATTNGKAALLDRLKAANADFEII